MSSDGPGLRFIAVERGRQAGVLFKICSVARTQQSRLSGTLL
jgi:hypothetical protein